MAHQEEQALLKAYIAEWKKFFTQCNYLPTPFRQLEASLLGKTSVSQQKKSQTDESIVRKVCSNFDSTVSKSSQTKFKELEVFIVDKSVGRYFNFAMRNIFKLRNKFFSFLEKFFNHFIIIHIFCQNYLLFKTRLKSKKSVYKKRN